MIFHQSNSLRRLLTETLLH